MGGEDRQWGDYYHRHHSNSFQTLSSFTLSAGRSFWYRLRSFDRASSAIVLAEGEKRG